MARIETDPNYTSPTFSRATAATDLFKKEDVQALAAAMSTHDHSTGKGLMLTAGAIPSGLITSTMIADGTIASGDLADGAVTRLKIAADAKQRSLGRYMAGPTFSSTTVGSFIETPVQANVNVSSGARTIEIRAVVTAQSSAAGNRIYIGIMIDGVLANQLGNWQCPVGAASNILTAQYTTTITAGAHRISVALYQNAAGTMSLDSNGNAYLDVLEWNDGA